MATRLLVVENQRIVRELLADLLASEADLEIVGEASTGAEALRLVRELAGDVVLCVLRTDTRELPLPAKDGRSKAAREAISLAPRERQVVALLAEGKRSAEIGKQLGISVATVDVYRRNIMRKLDLHTIAELTKFALREGLTSL